jgi:hypothetical protein
MVVVLIAALTAVAACTQDDSDNRSGAGLNYRGSFYNLSSLEVAPAALGQILDRQVPFQDTRIDLRRIRGVQPSFAVAGFTRTYLGTGSPEPMAWLLLSPNPALAADPLSDPTLQTVVLDPRRR